MPLSMSTRLLRLMTEDDPCAGWLLGPVPWRAGVEAPLEPLCPTGERPPPAGPEGGCAAALRGLCLEPW